MPPDSSSFIFALPDWGQLTWGEILAILAAIATVLGTIEEAMSLMESKKNKDGLYIDPVFDQKQRWIWTMDQPSASAAWYVFFSLGGCDDFDMEVYDRYVRAVRSGH